MQYDVDEMPKTETENVQWQRPPHSNKSKQ